MPLIPRPPRPWTLKLSSVILLIYPREVMAMTTFSFLIRSSISKSPASCSMRLLRSSPNFSAMIFISSLMTVRSFLGSARIPFSSAILSIRSWCSFSSFSLSRPVRARRRMSTIACAWTSSRPNLSVRRAFAVCTLGLSRMILTTSSMLSSAMSRPCKIWSLSSALLRS